MRQNGLAEITLAGSMIRFASIQLPESRQVRLKRLYPKGMWRPATETVLIPKPVRRDADLLAFVTEVIDQIIDPTPVASRL
jgi:transcription-repair coupling factor (superfamily II helicase)